MNHCHYPRNITQDSCTAQKARGRNDRTFDGCIEEMNILPAFHLQKANCRDYFDLIMKNKLSLAVLS